MRGCWDEGSRGMKHSREALCSHVLNNLVPDPTLPSERIKGGVVNVVLAEVDVIGQIEGEF